MTLTIELAPEIESLLRAVARERGVTLEEVIADRINLDFSAEALEELEDELDIAAAERAREEDRRTPGERKTLDDLRRARLERVT